jgi:hypothetical protein
MDIKLGGDEASFEAKLIHPNELVHPEVCLRQTGGPKCQGSVRGRKRSSGVVTTTSPSLDAIGLERADMKRRFRPCCNFHHYRSHLGLIA